MSMPVVVQTVGDTTFRSSPISLPFTSNITAGNALVAFAWINSLTGTPTLTDSQGNTWVWQSGHAPVSNGGITTLVCFLCSSALSTGANTATLTFSGGGAGNLLSITEISGSNGTIDQIASGHNASPSTPYNSGSITTTQPNSLVLAMFQPDGTSSPNIASPYILLSHTNTGNLYGVSGYTPERATGTYNAQVDSPGTDVGYIIFNLYGTADAPGTTIQAASNSGVGDTNVTLTGQVINGDYIVVIADSILGQGTVTLVDDNHGNTYTMVDSFTQLAGAQGHIIQIWVAPVGSNQNSLVITAHSTSGFLLVSALDYATAGTFTYDQHAVANNGGGTTQSVGPTGTTTATDEVLIAYIAPNTGSVTITPNAPYTGRVNVSPTEPNFGATYAVEDQLVSSSSAYSATFTLSSGSFSTAMALVTFKVTFTPPPSTAKPVIIIFQ